jgi:hypothetical protein
MVQCPSALICFHVYLICIYVFLGLLSPASCPGPSSPVFSGSVGGPGSVGPAPGHNPPSKSDFHQPHGGPASVGSIGSLSHHNHHQRMRRLSSVSPAPSPSSVPHHHPLHAPGSAPPTGGGAGGGDFDGILSSFDLGSSSRNSCGDWDMVDSDQVVFARKSAPPPPPAPASGGQSSSSSNPSQQVSLSDSNKLRDLLTSWPSPSSNSTSSVCASVFHHYQNSSIHQYYNILFLSILNLRVAKCPFRICQGGMNQILKKCAKPFHSTHQYETLPFSHL